VIQRVKKEGCRVEALIPDFQGNLDLVKKICDQNPEVISHNIETVRRLTPTVRDPRAGYDQSLSVLSFISRNNTVAKSSIMLGLGETDQEVLSTMEDLLSVGVSILTIGQYLRPSKMQLPVTEYCSMERFNMFREKGMEMGFDFVASGPLVRSSYRAAEAFLRRGKNGNGKINFS
jgi:lipoic acid synthetase